MKDWTKDIVYTTISYGMAGKNGFYYGDNNLGKGKQFSKLAHKDRKGDKGFILPIEPNGSAGKSDVAVLSSITSYGTLKNFVKDMYRGMVKKYEIETKINKYQVKIDSLQIDIDEADNDKQRNAYQNQLDLNKKNLRKQKKKLQNNVYHKMQKQYEFAILDGVDLLSKSCEKFVTDQKKILEISDLDDYGATYKRFENEFIRTFSLYCQLGFTMIFIDHATDKKIGGTMKNPIKEKYPKGSKRVVDPILDVCEIIGYLEHGGYDEETGKERNSQMHMYRIPEEFFGRTKWDMPDYLEEFTLENLEKAINEGVAKEEANGATVVNQQERVTKINVITETVEELQQTLFDSEKIITDFDDEHDTSYIEQFWTIVDSNLGTGTKIKEITDEQKHHALLAIMDINDLIAKLGSMSDEEIVHDTMNDDASINYDIADEESDNDDVEDTDDEADNKDLATDGEIEHAEESHKVEKSHDDLLDKLFKLDDECVAKSNEGDSSDLEKLDNIIIDVTGDENIKYSDMTTEQIETVLSDFNF